MLYKNSSLRLLVHVLCFSIYCHVEFRIANFFTTLLYDDDDIHVDWEIWEFVTTRLLKFVKIRDFYEILKIR